jgi:hypothetical protein|tara:strand:+ start:1783 stop:2640 length:858 start_codon:yes stop_codon:yes gene_type:complete
MEQFLQEARALLPWLPESLIQIYANSFAETQNKDIAIAEVRASEDYETYFPKNKRDDGTVRLSESDYASVKESYGLTIEDYGMNKDYFENTFATLIEKGVSPNEFRQRVASASDGITQNIPAVREYYATNFNLELNDNQILASVIDPDIGQAIIEGRITQAQIGGEAQARGFNLNADEVQALERAGLTQAQARQLFAAAEQEVPRLATLARRFEPESIDETETVTPGGLTEREGYDIEEFVEAQVFGSAEEKERVRRLQAQEESLSSPIGGAARKGGRVTGLTQG